jgi:hypothetical protein
MTVTLWKEWAAGETDYIQRLIDNATTIENALNDLYSRVAAQSGGVNAMPLPLQEIFDRRGLLGVGSYDFSEGTLSGPSYNFTVQAGAYWNPGTFYRKTGTSVLSMAGLATGTYYLNLDSAGNPLVSATADATTTRQFTWNSSTHALAAKALYTGVAILLDGDDYADLLTSAARAKSFTKVADRLEEIEVLLSKTVQTPASANNITINWAQGGIARVLLDRATTTFTFTGAYDGQKLILELLQDGVGGRAAAFGAETVPGADFTFPVPLSGADKRDFVGFIYSAGNSKYNYVSLARGY